LVKPLDRSRSGRRLSENVDSQRLPGGRKKEGVAMTPILARPSPIPRLSDPPKNTVPENGILLKPIRRVRLYENAVDQIQTLILRKRYKPGDRLPSERSLAQQFHISRHSLREALRILDVMGLIEIRVGDGIYVKEVDFLPYIESLNLSIRNRLQIEQDTFVKLWEARKILEVGMVELAAKQINESFLKSLQWCIEEMKKNIAHRDAFISSGIRFHRLIAEIGRNEVVILVWDMLANLMRKSQTKIYRISLSPQNALAAHRKIYLALEARDSRKAVEAMKKHMAEEEEALQAALTRVKDKRAGSSRRNKKVKGPNLNKKEE
jgi:GntR family transcriptional regulator, transcriptional repressor for pyruvate dehydrogenase complex